MTLFSHLADPTQQVYFKYETLAPRNKSIFYFVYFVYFVYIWDKSVCYELPG